MVNHWCSEFLQFPTLHAGQPEPGGGEDAAGFHPAKSLGQAGDSLPQQEEVHIFKGAQRRQHVSACTVCESKSTCEGFSKVIG